jgi:hypothetical protein
MIQMIPIADHAVGYTQQCELIGRTPCQLCTDYILNTSS